MLIHSSRSGGREYDPSSQSSAASVAKSRSPYGLVSDTSRRRLFHSEQCGLSMLRRMNTSGLRKGSYPYDSVRVGGGYVGQPWAKWDKIELISL